MFFCIDYTCQLSESHSWDAILRFANAIEKVTLENVTIVIPQSTKFSDPRLQMTHQRLFKKQINGKKHKLNIIDYFYAVYKISQDLLSYLKKKDCVGVIFPGIDASSILAVYLLAPFFPNKKFYIRFIGWTEFWIPSKFLLKNWICKKLNKRNNVKFATETASLADYLNINAKTVPYPLKNRGVTKFSKKQAYLVGSARREKGFNEFAICALEQNNSEIQYIMQESTKPWVGYSEILKRLKNSSQVKLLPAIIPRDLMEKFILDSIVCVMPYSKRHYEIRGSAAFYESIELNTPVIAFEGLGFSADILNFNLGEIAVDLFDLNAAIYRQMNKNNVNSGFSSYINYTQEQLKNWLNDLQV